MADTLYDTTERSQQQRPHQTLFSQTSVLEKNRLEKSTTVESLSKFDEGPGQTQQLDGDAHFRHLGWKRLTVVLIVESVALGSLSLPAAFATLGMVAGVVCCVGLGLVAIFTGNIVGQVKLKYPEIAHYADSGRLLFEKKYSTFGYELFGAMTVIQLILLVGSHVLTGTIAFLKLSDNGGCSAALGFASTVILLALAIPPSFADVAILGYVDCISILSAIVITMVATGVQASNAEGGLAAVDWSAWPKPGVTFVDGFIAIANIIFAYTFCLAQFSFMDDMHTPQDYMKSIWSLGIIEISIYTLTGGIIYALVGSEVKSPALLSAGPSITKIAFGVALPVIFISGSINITVLGRFLHGRMFKNSPARFINTPKGWASWLAIITVIALASYVVAESIPFFSDLLSLLSSLFVSGFSFYFPALMWFILLREGSCFARENIVQSFLCACTFIIGIVILVCGTYASLDDIVRQFREGKVGGVFTCDPIG